MMGLLFGGWLSGLIPGQLPWPCLTDVNIKSSQDLPNAIERCCCHCKALLTAPHSHLYEADEFKAAASSVLHRRCPKARPAVMECSVAVLLKTATCDRRQWATWNVAARSAAAGMQHGLLVVPGWIDRALFLGHSEMQWATQKASINYISA